MRFLPVFMWHNWKSARQASRADGFLGGRLLVDRRRRFWTMTMWSDDASMTRFRNSGAHRAAMPKLARWCSEASTVHWSIAASALPSWSEAHARMTTAGREFSVEHRDPAFRLESLRPPRFPSRLETALRARGKRP